MMPTMPTVCVSYSSHERPFIRALLRQARIFSSRIVVAVGSRLYSGEPEDEAGLLALKDEFKDVGFVRYAVDDHELSTPIVLHNRSRLVAARHNASSVDGWCLFLDGDEVPDGERFRRWWMAHGAQLSDHSDVAHKMANYWYFLDPHMRAETLEDSIVLVHGRHTTVANLSHRRERDGILFMAMASTGMATVECMVTDDNGIPMFHHFSWVRQRDALFAKVKTWGHAGDRTDWRERVEHGLQQLAKGEVPYEFVHGYLLTRVHASDIPAGVTPDLSLLVG